MTGEEFGDLLAPVNASLNLASTVFLLAGFVFIKRREVGRHRWAMVGAVGVSAVS